MKEIVKSGLSLVLALTIVLGSAYVGLGEFDFGEFFAVKAEAASKSDLTFKLNGDGKSYYVHYCSYFASGELVIPSTYNGLPVTRIGNSAFSDCTSLTSVTIPDSVTSIGDWAFDNTAYYNNSSNWVDGVLYIGNHLIDAKKINDNYIIKDGTKTIADIAFYYCTSLTSITIPNSVTSIGYAAFTGCRSLISINVDANNKNYSSVNGVLFNKDKTVLIRYPEGKTDTKYTIPDSVTSIGRIAFSNCTSLTSITIPDSVTSVGDSAFYYCTSLTSITIPDSVTSIGDYVFYKCTSLTSVTIPNSVTSVGDSAFRYCESLTSVTIPNSVTSIGAYAFADCTSLTSITIPDSVTSIGDYVFYKCTSLTSVTIPNSVTSIGDSAFYDCYSLKYVFYTGSGTGWANITIGTGNAELTKFPIHYNATGHTSSDWITDKNATVNAAGSKHKECTVCKAVLEKETIPQLKCAAPKLTKVEGTGSGVKVTWGKTSGADSYNIYRKTYSNGKWSGWSTIKTGATGTTYTDTTAKSGVYYIYTVRAKNEAGLSGYNSTGLKIKFLATPKLSSVSNGSGKVTVKWGKVTGASSYTVYRKTYSNGKWSGWSKIGTTKNTYYNDAKVSSGKYYKYTVRATSGDYSSYYNTSGLQIKYLAGPKISSASSRRDGILINWNKITGASGYYVYRKTSSGDWKKIATVKGNTKIKYLDETPRKGVTYQYRVKAYSGNYTSTYANTYKIKCKY